MSFVGDSWCYGTARQQAAAIAAGQLSASRVVECYLQRIEALDGELHAFASVYADDARQAAEAADSAIRSGHAVGPLHGVPIAVKDVAEIAGRITSGGSLAWAGRRSQTTATLVEKLLSQGMILLGKTHTVEFTCGGWGTNTRMGTPRNPWDMNRFRAPGGSSSGSGVAVGAGLAPWAVGTDTGGSVRIPASWCGLTTLKTSAGRISNHGMVRQSQTLDTPGPMALDAEDAAWLYRVMAGPDPRDRRSLGLPEDIDHPGSRNDIAGLRLACMPEAERKGVDDAVLAAYDRSLEDLRSLGAHIVPLDLPFTFARMMALCGDIMAAESYANLRAWVDDPGAPLDEDVRARIARGKGISAADYLQAIDERGAWIRRFDSILRPFDALLTPTTRTTAVLLEHADQSTSPAHFTRFVNYLDLCAAALPNGVDGDGMPTSLQIVCHRYDEAMALRIAIAYQRHTRWHLSRPRLIMANESA